jgi:hypothetical protein
LGALALEAVNAYAATPVSVREEGARLTLANDYLERTIEVTSGSIHTIALVNKLSGRTHEVRGDEFELKLIYERVGYNFGVENPLLLTSRNLQVTGHEVQGASSGGKRAVYHLTLPNSPQKRTGLEATLTYELKPDERYTRQWIELKTTGAGTFFIDSVVPPRISGLQTTCNWAVSGSRSFPTTCSWDLSIPPASTRLMVHRFPSAPLWA